MSWLQADIEANEIMAIVTSAARNNRGRVRRASAGVALGIIAKPAARQASGIQLKRLFACMQSSKLGCLIKYSR